METGNATGGAGCDFPDVGDGNTGAGGAVTVTAGKTTGRRGRRADADGWHR